MSNCIANIVIAGEPEPISFAVDSDTKSLDELSGLLYSETNKGILDLLRQKLPRTIGNKIKLTSKMLEGQIVGNCNVGYLKGLYPELSYPNEFDPKINILLYDSGIYKGIPLSSGVLQTNNGLTYILPNSEYSVRSFLEYNVFTEKVLNDDYYKSIINDLIKNLPDKIKKLDVLKQYSIIGDVSSKRFIYDYFFNNKFREALKTIKIDNVSDEVNSNDKSKLLGINKGTSIHIVLNNLFKLLVHDGSKLENDEVVNNFVSIIDENKANKSKTSKIVTLEQLIKLNDIYELATINDPTVDSEAFMREVIAVVNTKNSNLKFDIDKVLSNSVILKSNVYYKNIQDYPSFGLNDLGNSVIKTEEYSGYNVYQIDNENIPLNKSYIVSNTEFNHTTLLNTFGSIQEARNEIKNLIKKDTIGSIDYLAISGRNRSFTANTFYKDSVIKAYKPISELETLSCSAIKNSPRYKSMLKMNLDKFKSEYKKQLKNTDLNELVDTVESSQDAQILLGFLYANNSNWSIAIKKFSELKENDDLMGRYIISKTDMNTSKNEHKFTHKIVSLTSDESFTQINEKIKRPQSIINVLNNLTGVLANRFGVNVHSVDDDFVKEMFPNIPNQNSIKAFVYNGEVYINLNRATPADTVHEFMHLALGLMKQTDINNYMSLLKGVENSSEFKKFSRNPIYKDRAQTDILEEVVVSLIGNYVEEQLFDINELDKSIDLKVNSSEIESLTNSIMNIFNYKEEMKNINLRRLAGSSLIDLFNSFSNINEEPMFNKEKNKDLARDSRTISNIIEKGIKDKEIEEDCDGV